uniref:Secreted peptide n=1 Tax=Rhipicephalus pulchellus TaxID=72859 RepID=L7LY33_RHIPC
MLHPLCLLLSLTSLSHPLLYVLYKAMLCFTLSPNPFSPHITNLHHNFSFPHPCCIMLCFTRSSPSLPHPHFAFRLLAILYYTWLCYASPSFPLPHFVFRLLAILYYTCVGRCEAFDFPRFIISCSGMDGHSRCHSCWRLLVSR